MSCFCLCCAIEQARAPALTTWVPPPFRWPLPQSGLYLCFVPDAFPTCFVLCKPLLNKAGSHKCAPFKKTSPSEVPVFFGVAFSTEETHTNGKTQYLPNEVPPFDGLPKKSTSGGTFFGMGLSPAFFPTAPRGGSHPGRVCVGRCVCARMCVHLCICASVYICARAGACAFVCARACFACLCQGWQSRLTVQGSHILLCRCPPATPDKQGRVAARAPPSLSANRPRAFQGPFADTPIFFVDRFPHRHLSLSERSIVVVFF